MARRSDTGGASPPTHPKARALALMVGVLVIIVLLAATSAFGSR
jgi:hypothetical protein